METKKLLRILKFLILMLFVNVCYAGCEPKSLTSVENEPQLLIFVSLSMPEQSLKLWAEQAEKIKGKLLLKGFVDDSLQATIDETLRIFKEPKADFLVHPEAFEKFNIDKVPAVVIASPDDCLEDDCPAPLFDVVYGDTSLEDALNKIASSGEHHQKTASDFLSLYRRSHD